MIGFIARLLKNDRGVSAVEFALVAPMLVLMLIGLADFGLAANEKMRLLTAARAGAQSGFGDPANGAAIIQAAKDASGLQSKPITVTTVTTCACPDGGAAACDGTCGGGAAVRSFVTVTVTETYGMLFDYPMLGKSVALSATASLRVQ
jgi:Flp pilus assembly protein TadG